MTRQKFKIPILIGSFLLLIFGCSLLTCGCSSEECLQNRNALPLAGFYNAEDHKQEVTINSLEVYGIGAPGDSILSPGTQGINQLYLPFRLDQDTTRYVFRYLQEDLAQADIRDTVTFIYDRNPRFVSSACGVSYVFGIKKIRYTRSIIDSVACPLEEITNMDTENLSIFFHVSTEPEPSPDPDKEPESDSEQDKAF